MLATKLTGFETEEAPPGFTGLLPTGNVFGNNRSSTYAYFFGDSRTDTGNIAREFAGSFGDSYPGQYFSDGPTWAKYLDPSVQTALQGDGDYRGSVDFSYRLSTTGIINEFQVDDLFTNLAPSVSSSDKAFLWGGANDGPPAFRASTPPSMESWARSPTNTGVSNLTTSADALKNTHGFRSTLHHRI